MNKFKYSCIPLLVVCFMSCEDSDDNDCCEMEEPHECVEYMPSQVPGGLVSTWDEPGDVDIFPAELTTPPDDLGGGIFTVSLSTEGPAIPALSITADGDESGVILGGSSAQTNNEQLWTGSFLGYPGVSYSLRAISFVEGDEYPWGYSISWSFEGRMDCYEPNDVMADAKAIPKDLEIEAFAHGGHIKNFVATGADQTYDWYKFSIFEPSKVRVAIVESPSDIRMGLRIFESGAVNLGINTVATDGSLSEPGVLFYVETMNILEPGTYFVETHHDMARPSVNKGEEIPDYWSTPYKLEVTTVD